MKSLRRLFVGFASFAMLVVAMGSIGPAIALNYDEPISFENLDTSFDLLSAAEMRVDAVQLAEVKCTSLVRPIPIEGLVWLEQAELSSVNLRTECLPSIGRDPPAD